jgi:membrane protein YqaA with SNARE-associated domain
MDLIAQLLDILQEVASDPVQYLIVVFVYSIATAVFLPVPVEAALFLSESAPFWSIALVLSLGKTVGGFVVYSIGGKLEGPIRTSAQGWRIWNAFVGACERFVLRFGYLGFYALLSIPIMPDTLTLYLFSLFNKEGKVMDRGHFLIVNFLGSLTRCAIVYVAADILRPILGI